MVTKKIHQKKTDGTVVEVDLGCDGKNVTQDVTHRFVSDTEKSTWNNKAPKTAFTGATASAAGAMGLVPVPAAGKQKAYLRGDGTWENADDHTATFTQASARTNIVSGEKLSVIFGKIAKVIADLISHLSNTSNPHSVTKAQVGLGNADNTSDANKPVSAAQQAAIDAAYANSNYYTDEKIAALINGAPTTLDTLGEIAEAMEENASVVDALEAAIGERAKESEFTSHVNNTSNPHNVTKEQVGLGNVPNVSTNNQTPTYTAASALGELQSGEKLSVAFGKIKLAVTNVINIVKLLGTTDISALGNGTVTGAISDLNSKLLVPDYPNSVKMLSADVTSGTWSYKAASNGFLMLNFILKGGSAVAASIKAATPVYESNVTASDIRMSRVIPMSADDIITIADCSICRVSSATVFVPSK